MEKLTNQGTYMLQLINSLKVATEKIVEGSPCESNYLREKIAKLQKEIDYYDEIVASTIK